MCVGGGAADRFDKTIAPTGLLFAFKNLELQIWDQSKTPPPWVLVGLIGTCVAPDTVASMLYVSAPCCLPSQRMFLGVIHLAPIRRQKQMFYEDLLVSGHSVLFQYFYDGALMKQFHLQAEQNSVKQL